MYSRVSCVYWLLYCPCSRTMMMISKLHITLCPVGTAVLLFVSLSNMMHIQHRACLALVPQARALAPTHSKRCVVLLYPKQAQQRYVALLMVFQVILRASLGTNKIRI